MSGPRLLVPRIAVARTIFDIGALVQKGGRELAISIPIEVDHVLQLGAGIAIDEQPARGTGLRAAARILGSRIAGEAGAAPTVGVLLPNANGVVISLLGLWSAGNAAAMLNYTAGPANVASAITTAAPPSTIPDALPAVTKPSFPNEGRSFASPSIVVSDRI